MSPLDFLISPAHAQAAAAPAQGSPLISFIMLGGVFVLMYFLMIRPQMKRQKEHRQLVEKLAKGDEIVTSGGIAGRIEDVGESFITVEIAEGTRIRVQKGAVNAILPKGTLKSL